MIIPAINEINFEEIKKKIETAVSFGATWVHIDVADGKFTRNVLWNNFLELKDFARTQPINIEVHLMIENPDAVVGDWIAMGVKRIVVHIETIQNVQAMKTICEQAGVELCLALNPETPIERLIPFQDLIPRFLILAVRPGLSGQVFLSDQLEKIKTLRTAAPNVIIEVDGGVNLENVAQIKAMGAHVMIAASAIWKNAHPAKAFQELVNI